MTRTGRPAAARRRARDGHAGLHPAKRQGHGAASRGRSALGFAGAMVFVAFMPLLAMDLGWVGHGPGEGSGAGHPDSCAVRLVQPAPVAAACP